MKTGSSSFGFSTDEQGQFQMWNIPPGYRLGRNRPVWASAGRSRILTIDGGPRLLDAGSFLNATLPIGQNMYLAAS